MSRNNSYKAIFSSLLLLLTVLVADAQSKTSVKATVDKNKILIGETIQLSLQADIPENEAIHFFIIDSIPHFEIKEKQKIDTSNTSEGTVLRQIILITSFDSGHWVMPAFVLGENIVTDTIPVDVVFSDFNPEQNYHDIKDIIEVNPEQEKEKWWLWYAIGGGALLIVVLLIYLLRKKKPAVQAPVTIIDPYAEAMKQLEKLQKEQTDQKQYYSRLVDIFRVYVSKKKGIHSLQETTNDLVVQLKGMPVTKEQFEKLSQALRLSDFVKFAKYIPATEEDKNAFETIKNSITSIERLT
jgi:uncharacterized integral membrane protein